MQPGDYCSQHRWHFRQKTHVQQRCSSGASDSVMEVSRNPSSWEMKFSETCGCGGNPPFHCIRILVPTIVYTVKEQSKDLTGKELRNLMAAVWFVVLMAQSDSLVTGQQDPQESLWTVVTDESRSQSPWLDSREAPLSALTVWTSLRLTVSAVVKGVHHHCLEMEVVQESK